MLFLATIYINYALSEVGSFGKDSLRIAVREIRNETGLDVRVGRRVHKVSSVKVFEVPRNVKTIYIYQSHFKPVGEGEICGNRSFAYIDSTPVGSSNLIKHEVLHMLGASHYQGFMNDVTDRVMRSIKRCLHLGGLL